MVRDKLVLRLGELILSNSTPQNVRSGDIVDNKHPPCLLSTMSLLLKVNPKFLREWGVVINNISRNLNRWYGLASRLYYFFGDIMTYLLIPTGERRTKTLFHNIGCEKSTYLARKSSYGGQHSKSFWGESSPPIRFPRNITPDGVFLLLGQIINCIILAYDKAGGIRLFLNPNSKGEVGIVEQDQLTGEVVALENELTRLLRQPTLDDMLAYIFASNVRGGKVWANYQLLKDFYEQLKAVDEWNSGAVAAIIARVELTRDIDHCMTRLGIGGLVSWTCDVGDDHFYMDEGQVDEVLKRISRMDSEIRADLEEISSLYHALLESVGRQ